MERGQNEVHKYILHKYRSEPGAHHVHGHGHDLRETSGSKYY